MGAIDNRMAVILERGRRGELDGIVAQDTIPGACDHEDLLLQELAEGGEIFTHPGGNPIHQAEVGMHAATRLLPGEGVGTQIKKVIRGTAIRGSDPCEDLVQAALALGVSIWLRINLTHRDSVPETQSRIRQQKNPRHEKIITRIYDRLKRKVSEDRILRTSP